ncbi:MAG: M20/M25/M40 family metallo-hydrolase [Planctomycetota bacterium]
MIDRDQGLGLLCDWIAVDSTTGREGDYGDLIGRALEGFGFGVEAQAVAPGRRNVLARAGRPEVVFCTHLDTVPPYIAPRRARGTVHGRGACDAKGQALAMLMAADELVRSGEDRVGFLLTVGEEVDSAGAAHADARMADDPSLRDAWRPRYTIVGEPTGNRFVRGHKGIFLADLVAHGVAGHSGNPLGPSAVHALVGCCARLVDTDFGHDPVLGPGTVNVGTIHGGEAPNVVAPAARAEILVRAVDEPDRVRARIEATLGSNVELREGREQYGPVHFHVPDGEEAGPVSFGTDAPHLTRWGRPLLFGPGSIDLAHTDEERIEWAEIEAAAARHVRTVRELLAAPD